MAALSSSAIVWLGTIEISDVLILASFCSSVPRMDSSVLGVEYIWRVESKVSKSSAPSSIARSWKTYI